ncbi:DUF1835 domain-containing protein [Chitinophaga sp. SYP-B3965]|uniref:DUF1835 domain-containing protein n=1 Tax=Chitinophaga sp. SYP-B3965 TaxID=2663120 RepID=UPI0012995A42|nr:DUF1835 domain-containing protein [Chitinophaga sp. SYP-B3965]MRG44055.1 DUF1835 domain-containing protein [Chitinophaga sp. SYP-B3965]
MILHIVFGQSSEANLKAAFELDPALAGEILCFEDDLAVGPLFILDTPEGRTARREWWNNMLDIPAIVPAEGEEVPAPEDPVRSLKGRLREEEELEVWIWAGQNACDVSGYFWLISQLDRFSGRINLVYLNNLPFLNEKNGVFYPTHLSQILPKEFIKAKKLAREVSLAEFELDGDEWHRLMNENAGIRLLEGGKKLRGEPASFFDKDLVLATGKEFQKANKVIVQVTGKFKYPVMDQFLSWRIKELIKEGKIESKGELKTMRDFEIKLPGGSSEATPAENA